MHHQALIRILLRKLRYEKLANVSRLFAFSALLSALSLSVTAQPDLEDEVPALYKSSLGTLSISDAHFRIGQQSLRWDWVAGDTLIMDLSPEEKSFVNTNINSYAYTHFEMWVHNEAAGRDTFNIQFINDRGDAQFRFSFNVNFEGWRRLIRSYKYDMYRIRENYTTIYWNVDKIYLLAPIVGSGSIFIDNIQYMRSNARKHSDRVMPDLYDADINKLNNLSSNYYYSLDTITPIHPVANPTSSHLAELNMIRQRIRTYSADLGAAPSSVELNNANTHYNSFDIRFTDGKIRGKNINRPKDFSSSFIILMRDFVHNGNESSREKAVNLLKLMLDNGIAGGSGRWFAGGAEGYGDREFYKALISIESLDDDHFKYQIWDWLKWSTDINLGWHPDPNGKFNTDNFHVLFDAFKCIIILSPDDRYAVQSLYLLKSYLEKFLTPQNGDSDGLKPDGTGFHHQAHYNSYMYAYGTIASFILPLLQGTSFQINPASYDHLVIAFYALGLMTNKTEYAYSLSGRLPFDLETPLFSRDYTNLAITGGSITGSSPYDPVVAAMQKRIFRANAQFAETNAEPFPTGFWQMNYSPLALFRKNSWCVTIKGVNKYFWGTETFPNQNRYGRYQAYGSLTVMYDQGAAASGLAEPGWDWVKVPGATTITLPYSELGSVATINEFNALAFAGGARFGVPQQNSPTDRILEHIHGNYGMFGMTFQQTSASPSHNPSFKFRKSFFCFDDMILCLGSNINNNDGLNETITTLYQNALSSANQVSYVNGNSYSGTSTSLTLSEQENQWLVDAYKTGYFVLKGNAIKVERKSQTTPIHSASGATATGDFANAYISHGYAPSSASYAYVVVPNTTPGQMAGIAQNIENEATTPFTIIQQDSAAHIVRENKTNVFGFSFFLPNNNLTNTPYVKANSHPCVSLMRKTKDTLRISLVNPDLNLVNNVSTAIPITLTLNGAWQRLPDPLNQQSAVISNEHNETIIQFTPADGLPAYITLAQVNEVILPIYHLSLTGRQDFEKKENLLSGNLQTSEDITVYLERSESGREKWETVFSSDFKSSPSVQQFSYNDNTIITNQDYQYRLRSREASGEWKFSNIIFLNGVYANASKTTITPNPANSFIDLILKSKPSTPIQWLISDANGKQVKHGQMNTQKTQISITELQPGYYIISLSNNESHPFVVIR